MLFGANQMKLSISCEIEKTISMLSMDELNDLLNTIIERKNSNNESYKMSKLPYYLSCEYYYKYCAYNELINFINYKSQNMVFK